MKKMGILSDKPTFTFAMIPPLPTVSPRGMQWVNLN